MKLKARDSRNALSVLRLSLALSLATILPLVLYGSAPSWWSQRGVLVQNVEPDDYAPANQGQLRNIARVAAAEMDAAIPGGAGDEIHALLGTWSTPNPQRNDFEPVTAGQLKSVVKPFYNRLIAIKYTATYPWVSSGEVPDDFSVVNIGQVKNLFSFDFLSTDAAHDTDGNNLPDWWEKYYFGKTGLDPNAPAPRGDGSTNLRAFQQRLDPIDDGHVFAINPERIDETVPTGETLTRRVSVTNTTNKQRELTFFPHAANAIINYNYIDSNKEGGPEFVWNDISVTGVHLEGVSDVDNGFEGFPLSFSFPYYGANDMMVYVASDGFVTLGSGSDYWWGGMMPDKNSPAAMIAAFEDDLDLSASGDVYYQDYGDRVVVQFQNAVRYYGDGSVTMQIVLQQDGTILFYYKDMEGVVDEAVVGIQNLATNQGLTIAYYQTYLQSNLAIRITPSTAWQPAPWLHVAPATTSLAPGASAQLSVTLDGGRLAPGLYSGGITLSCNDPSVTSREFPVTMTLVDESQLDDDNDGLTNSQERALGTDPKKIDTDGDGMPDGWEVAHGLNPLAEDASEDPDGDGFTNLQEYRKRSDPFDYFDGVTPFLDIVSGNNQFGSPGSLAARPLTVRARKADGQPYVNALVSFAVPSGSGQLASTGSPAVLHGNQMMVRTDADGLASVGFLFSEVPGNSSRVTAGTRAFDRFVTTDFRAVSTYHRPPSPAPSPGASPPPGGTPTSTPAPPYRYALIDLGKDTFPERVNNKGLVLMYHHEDSIRWKAGVSEVLINSRPSTPYIAWDLNDDGTVVGTGGDWGSDESPNINNSGDKEVSWGLLWPPENSFPTEIRGSVAPHWVAAGRTIQRAFLRAISNPTAETGSADLYGGAYDGSAYSIGLGGAIFYKDIINAYRWSGSGGSPTPLSFSRSLTLNEIPWGFDWKGPIDRVMRANSSRHYIGTRVTPGTRVGGVNTFSFSGMIDAQSVDFEPTDINEAGIVVGYRDSAMIVRTPGALDQTITGRSNLYPVAVNDHSFQTIPQSSPAANPSATPTPAPQILASDGNVLLLWQRQPDGVTWYPFSLEAMIPNMDGWSIDYVTDMNDNGMIIGRASYKDPANPMAELESHGIMLAPVELTVDGNRDGEMSFDDPIAHDADQTSEDKPYRFWINDDQDAVSGTNQSEEITPPQLRDDQDEKIQSLRDCEDLARLWLNIGGLTEGFKTGEIQLVLRFRNVKSGNPAIRVFRAVENGGRGYVSNEAWGTLQASPPYDQALPGTNGPGIASSTTGIYIDRRFWAGIDESDPVINLLFEGVEEGLGELYFDIIRNGQRIGASPGVWIDIKNVEKMYERAKAQPEDIVAPYAVSQPVIGPVGYVADPNGNPFEKPSDETDQCVIFVHGWNVGYNEYTGVAQTMFKRLWHQGFRGHFASLRWDTRKSDGMFDVGEYNRSENRAYVYAAALKEWASVLSNSYTVSVVAHSMGNIVCGEALRQGLQIRNYALMEAAIPMSCYVADAARLPRLEDRDRNYPTPDYHRNPTTNELTLGYRGYLPPFTANMVNFYNEDDWALATGTTEIAPGLPHKETNWETNQIDYKPDGEIPDVIHAVTWRYFYDPSLPPALPLARRAWTESAVDRFVTDSWEIKAFVARSRTKAVGAFPNGNAVFTRNVNLNSSPYNFGRQRSDHSGQFTRNIQQVDALYNALRKALEQ